MSKPDDDKNIVKLNFNTDRHDAHVEQAVAKDQSTLQALRQKNVKKAMHTIYEKWKKQVRGKARTPGEVTKATYELMAKFKALEKECDECGLADYHKFTIQIIEDKVASLVATGITMKNEITPYIPENPTLMDEDNDAIIKDDLRKHTKPVTFRTYEEFMALPFVDAFTKKTGFVGFVLHGNGVVAVFNDGATAGVGFLVNGIGVEKLPLLEDYAKAMEMSAAQAGTTPAESGSSPAPAADAPGSAESTPGTPNTHTAKPSKPPRPAA